MTDEPALSPDAIPLLASLRRDAAGLIPAIIQDADSHEVLMMAWMDDDAIRQTLATGESHFYSRSRGKLWHKGGTSGHVQKVLDIRVDCDADVLLLLVRQIGGACHEGYRSCFFRHLDASGHLAVEGETVFDPASVYLRASGG
jgi:phosphoribosyl-AMP cyclohydrolase